MNLTVSEDTVVGSNIETPKVACLDSLEAA